MPNTTRIEEIAALVHAAIAEADSEDDETALCAVRQQLEAVYELISIEAMTPREVAAKAQVCLAVLAAGGGLVEATESTRALLQSVLEEAARLSLTKS